MTSFPQTGVLIVGGGPTGMAMALELRSRGVDFALIEAGDGAVAHPKVSGIGPRSMELFRRWGVADRIRGSGWPGDHPLDCVWVTRIGGHELFRLPRHTMDTRPGYRHTPEPDAVCPQHWLAPLLREELGVHPVGPVRMRTRLEGFEQDGRGVTATVTDLANGETGTLRAAYLIACDGASSPVRKSCGIPSPARHETRVFRNILFRAPELRAELGQRHAHFFYLMVSAALRFPVRALDGDGLYRLTVGLQGDPESSAAPEALVRRAVAVDTPLEVLSDNEWHLVHRIADTFRHGRVFLVGDSAHTLSPSGGFGMNTGICGAADLGWKLAAALSGWAGPGLLDTYTSERRPVAFEGMEEAHRNLVRAMRRQVPGELDDDTPAGERARREVGERIGRSGVAREFDAPEIHLGFGYADSPLVVPDPEVTPEQPLDRRPNTRPGSRAPHAWVKPGVSTLDLFGDGFVLLYHTGSDGDVRPDGAVRPAEAVRTAEAVGPDEAGRPDYAVRPDEAVRPAEAVAASGALSRFVGAFAERGVPLTVVACDVPEVAEAYERPYVLVRPDGHVAWRGRELPPDPGLIADRVRGAAVVLSGTGEPS